MGFEKRKSAIFGTPPWRYYHLRPQTSYTLYNNLPVFGVAKIFGYLVPFLEYNPKAYDVPAHVKGPRRQIVGIFDYQRVVIYVLTKTIVQMWDCA